MKDYVVVTVTRPTLDPAEREKKTREVKEALVAFFAAYERRRKAK